VKTLLLYTTLCFTTQAGLEKAVNKEIKNGFKPQGGMSIALIHKGWYTRTDSEGGRGESAVKEYCQAMIKEIQCDESGKEIK
jgi:hypothetical protein